MVLAPTPVQQFFDDNGVLLSGGLLFCYAAGTTTKQAAFTDATGDTPLQNPVILNSRGEVAPAANAASCGLWLDPTLAYKFVLAPATAGDPPTSTFWTVDNVTSPAAAVQSALSQYEATLGGNPIGSVIMFAGTTAPTGWLLCYGQAISRSTYSGLFAIIGTAYGVGDGTTTFNLPDMRGRFPLGLDNMGGSAANRVTSAVSGVSADTLGATGGDQNAQADTLTATSAAVLGVTDNGHSHSISTNTIGNNVPSTEITGVPGASSSGGNTNTAYTGIAVSATVTTTVTSGLTGASQNIPPCQTIEFIIFTGTAS
jgi:microcystin-dependent protein